MDGDKEQRIEELRSAIQSLYFNISDFEDDIGEAVPPPHTSKNC